jgi:diguanylate cyclase (GGDEF)-like protein
MQKTIPYMDRLATVGMAIVLIVLAAVGIGGGVLTQQAVSRVTASVAQNRVLQQAQLLVNEEALLQRDYYLQPTTAVRQQFDAVNVQVVKQVDAIVRLVIPNPTAADRAAVASALSLQSHFVSASHLFFAATDRGNRTQAVAIDEQEAEPLIATLTQIVTAESSLKDQQLVTDAQTLTTTGQTVRLISVATFVPGLLLLLAFGLLFRGYRRQLAVATRAEMDLLQHAALTDNLTGLGNQRAFAEEESRALAQAQRDGVALAMALIDIDEFKQINDQHDHSYGDRVLAGLGAVLRGGRASDRAFRLGGDEFALILPATKEALAVVVVERLRAAVGSEIPGATISVGIATLQPGDPHTATLRERADTALYEAKRRGRNTIVTFSEVQVNAGLVSPANIPPFTT